ncbi:gliding motility protein GldM [Terrimonas rubra]|uniref:Gliding motility protein GldM n=1 Tax=Terrimonas rubra TaxID=1035890 RepID=A0ABW6A184_9BACT
MALPKEPRQKMINLMYLVLTCLLALNVSSEILNAFKTVNSSLEKTNTTVNASTSTILASLEEKTKKAETAERANIWYPKAQQAAALSKSVFDYIQSLKTKIITTAGGDPNNPDNPDKHMNEGSQEIVTRIMVKDGEAKKLYTMLADYKKNLLAIDPSIAEKFSKTLQIDLSEPTGKDGKKKDWDIANFNMVPTVAGLTILSKLQNDIKTSENNVVAHIHEQVGKVEVIFDSYAAVIGQSSNYLMPGQELEITAGVGAFSKNAQPKISIGGSSLSIGEDGTAHYKTMANSIGTHTVPVNISFFNQTTNKEESISKTITYTVGQANASIALDKMNVLYVGVDNPVTIAASGGGDDKVQVSISGGGGSISKVGAGKYIARVGTVTDDCRITVSVDGKVAGASQFRVRTIPKAQAYVGGNESGASIAAGAFRAQTGVGAGIKDFPFELKYQVVSFSFSIDTDDGDVATAACQGNLFSSQAQNYIKAHAKAGKTVTIDDIRVQGPDGRVSSAPSLVYYLK